MFCPEVSKQASLTHKGESEKTLQVLMIEDDHQYSRVVQIGLEHSQRPMFKVHVASSLEAGFRVLNDLRPDIILLDLHLPDSKGLPTLERLLCMTGSIPVLVLTGDNSASDGLAAVRMGADDYLVKRLLNRDSLLRCIQYAVSRRKNQEIKLRHEAIKDFVETLAHDLSLPMIGADVVLSALQSNRMQSLDESEVEMINALREANKKQLVLVKKLIEIYRYESDSASLVLEPVRLSTVIQQCLADFSASESVEVIYAGSAKSLSVAGDKSALLHLFSNLVDNALKYRTAGTPVQIMVEPGENFVVIKIHNTGPELPAELRSGQFQKFWRNVSGQRYVASTGLGLYLCHRIADVHSGRMVCESTGDGTTVKVYLPSL